MSASAQCAKPPSTGLDDGSNGAVTKRRTLHRNAVLLMVAAPLLWSIAGVVTRKLDVARGVEVTFWRSLFAALFVALYLLFSRRGLVAAVRASGAIGILSGAMWCCMFCCFMIALTQTTVANTLICESLGPLLTALLAAALLRERVGSVTWCAIGTAGLGLVWMFVSEFDLHRTGGMWIALGIPVASAVNIVAIKRVGARVDLVPAVLIGAVMSCIVMLPLAWPLSSNVHDIALLALLGVVQLGFPCMLMVRAIDHLAASETALLGLLEVVFGTLWAWLFANETPDFATLGGGVLVLAALIANEWHAYLSDANMGLAPMRRHREGELGANGSL